VIGIVFKSSELFPVVRTTTTFAGPAASVTTVADPQRSSRAVRAMRVDVRIRPVPAAC
jgi:hypothetical protein